MSVARELYIEKKKTTRERSPIGINQRVGVEKTSARSDLQLYLLSRGVSDRPSERRREREMKKGGGGKSLIFELVLSQGRKNSDTRNSHWGL